MPHDRVNRKEVPLIIHHRLMWVHSDRSPTLRAQCYRCGEELAQQGVLDWVGKETGTFSCRTQT